MSTVPEDVQYFQSAALYQTLLDEAENIIQVSDYQTHELLFVNQKAAAFAGKEKNFCKGIRCY